MSFYEARPQSAYLKMGIFGEAGSGKTFTSTRVAIGLHHHIKSDKPIFFMDTETGTDFVRHRFDAEKIKLQVSKTRAFAELIQDLDKIPDGAIVIIDSLTHFFTELVDSYLAKKQKSRMILPDWGPVKRTWQEFSTRYVMKPLHIIWAARSADVWQEVELEDGSKELRKTGTKARTEGQMAYEPSLLVEIELMRTSAKVGGNVMHRAYVLKDRFDAINGQKFDDPGFEAFLPHVQLLNLGGEHLAIETGKDSQAIFDDPNIGEKRALNKEILCEEIANEMKKLIPGQKEEDKLAKIKLEEEVFGTNSWTKISTLFKNDKLAEGLAILREKVADMSKPTEPEPVPVIPPVADKQPTDGKHSKKGARA